MTKTKTLEIVVVCDWCGGDGKKTLHPSWSKLIECLQCSGTGKTTKRIEVINYKEIKNENMD